MNLDDIKQILALIREHELAEFELEQEGMKIRIKKDAAGHHVVSPPAVSHATHHPLPASGAQALHSNTENGPMPATSTAPLLATDADSVELAVVKSPIVGTFYRSSEPGAPPYVEVGAVVKKGQVLCIIEAMKLMNEIDSEYEGELVQVYVENGQPVQYGERLFAIRRAN
jgi:acetyl-CoA carboxylase biotin carboxyl carrier protein